MNSESDKRLQEVKRIAAQNLAEAQKPTPCFMITQENWKALLTGFYSQLALMEKMDGWKRTKNRRRLPIYGQQRVYVRDRLCDSL